jgi:hypothetical protein
MAIQRNAGKKPRNWNGVAVNPDNYCCCVIYEPDHTSTCELPILLKFPVTGCISMKTTRKLPKRFFSSCIL